MANRREDPFFAAFENVELSEDLYYADGPEGEAARREYEGGGARHGAESRRPGRPRRQAAAQCDATRQAAMRNDTWLPRPGSQTGTQWGASVPGGGYVPGTFADAMEAAEISRQSAAAVAAAAAVASAAPAARGRPPSGRGAQGRGAAAGPGRRRSPSPAPSADSRATQSSGEARSALLSDGSDVSDSDDDGESGPPEGKRQKKSDAKKYDKLAASAKTRRAPATQASYATAGKKLEWYLDNHPGQDGGDGAKRADLFSHSRFEIILVGFYQWCVDGFSGLPTKKAKTKTMKPSAFKHLHAVLASDYTEQRLKLLAPGKAELAKEHSADAFDKHQAAVQLVREWPELGKRPAYKALYDTVKDKLQRKGDRPAGVDPHGNTTSDSLDRSDLQHFAHILLETGGYESARNLAMAMLCYSTVARGDECRAFHLCDILRFEASPVFSPCTAWLLTLVQHGGKTYTESQKALRAAIRSRDPLLCLHRALAAMLVERYNFSGFTFPDPDPAEEWHKVLLFCCGLDTSGVSYIAHSSAVKAVLAKLGKSFTHSTHLFYPCIYPHTLDT